MAPVKNEKKEKGVPNHHISPVLIAASRWHEGLAEFVDGKHVEGKKQMMQATQHAGTRHGRRSWGSQTDRPNRTTITRA
jgi:hypothetical protein